METIDYVSILFRWLHIGAGILWIGLLYFFNFVNAPFAATMDGDTKKKVVPELMPRALYFFRWGSAYTLLTGLILIGIVFEYGNQVLDGGIPLSGPGHALLYSFLLAPMIYDLLAKSPLGKDNRVFAAVGFVLICVVVYVMNQYANFGYRGYMMYTGAMFGSIMAYNVWSRIWPNQKKIITGIKTGTPADASVVAQAGTRSKHNTYLSVPLLWTMINMHSVTLSGECGWMYLAGAILIGWGLVWLMYKKAAKVKGF